MNDSRHYLVFGSSGTIGSACAEKLRLNGHVVHASRNPIEFERQLSLISGFDGIVWAQGINHSDSLENFAVDMYKNVLDANVTFILDSLKVLLNKDKINEPAHMVVLSSVWSHLSRPNKLSYGVSKAAIGGLVRSLAVDLGSLGIQINAVSPGPINSPMTIQNLNPKELERVITESPLKRLVTIDEVASIVCELAVGKLSGITGQEIVVDGGWSVSKLV